jgi:hypothetical protein
MSPPPARMPLPPSPAMHPPKGQAPAPLAARVPGAAPRTPPGQAAPTQPAVSPRAQGGAKLPPQPGSPQGIARTARVAAAGAQGTVSAVIEAVKLVDTVLSEENLVLRRHDAKAAAALQERKQAATRLYHERMRILFRDTEAARTMTLEQRAELVGLARGLDDRVKENAILLKATMDAIDRLFGCINQAAQQRANREVNYSRAGMVAANASPAAASIAFNRTV